MVSHLKGGSALLKGVRMLPQPLILQIGIFLKDPLLPAHQSLAAAFLRFRILGSGTQNPDLSDFDILIEAAVFVISANLERRYFTFCNREIRLFKESVSAKERVQRRAFSFVTT